MEEMAFLSPFALDVGIEAMWKSLNLQMPCDEKDLPTQSVVKNPEKEKIIQVSGPQKKMLN